MERKNIKAPDFAGITFNQYDLEYTYVEDGETLRGLVPFGPVSQEYPVLLVSKTGENLLIDKTGFDFEKHPEFGWARDTYKKLREDIQKLDSLPTGEGSVWQLFKAQGGFLALCEDGGVNDVAQSLNGQRNFPTEHHLEGGMTHPTLPIISVNSSMDYSNDRVLLHELTHNACLTLINYGQSDLFKAVIEVERANHSSDILSKVDDTITYQIQGRTYTENERYDELITRLHENRLKNPAEFKKQLPVLDCFFQNYLYPSVLAYVHGNGRTVDAFSEALVSPEAKEKFPQIYEQAHQRVLGQGKYDLKVKDILMPLNKSGYRQSDPKAKDTPAYHRAHQEQQAYQRESQTKIAPLCEELVSFMERLKWRSEVREKFDRRGLSQYLQKYANSTTKSEEQLRQAKSEYVDLNRPDPIKNAWRKMPQLVNFARKKSDNR